MLVQAFDRIDAESGRMLLAGVSEKTLYDSALTIMMRLVFLFAAEERGLLLLGDPLYDQHYAVSTLSELLRERADQHGEEVLERRHDAWCRLLATFRAVHADVEQIGHVYEGLLDHTAKCANEVILGLAGSKKSEPEIPLSQLEELAAKGTDTFIEFLAEETGRSEKALRKALDAATSEDTQLS